MAIPELIEELYSKAAKQSLTSRETAIMGIWRESVDAQAENKRLRGEEPIPDAWWKDCPKLAQKTMERIIDKNNDLRNRLEGIKELSDMYAPLYGTDKEAPWVRTMMAISGQAEQALKQE